jgi:hypothetical protein
MESAVTDALHNLVRMVKRKKGQSIVAGEQLPRPFLPLTFRGFALFVASMRGRAEFHCRNTGRMFIFVSRQFLA